MLDTPFDDDTVAIFIRMGRLMRHLKAVAKQAARQVGLEQFEYETLHHLMVRETPGQPHRRSWPRTSASLRPG